MNNLGNRRFLFASDGASYPYYYTIPSNQSLNISNNNNNNNSTIDTRDPEIINLERMIIERQNRDENISMLNKIKQTFGLFANKNSFGYIAKTNIYIFNLCTLSLGL